MRKSLMTATAIGLALCLCLAGTLSLYSQTFTNPVTVLYLTSSTGQPIGVSPQNPLPVSASVSASVSGFVPSLSYNTCTSTGSQCTSTALPTNTGSVVLFNTGTTTVSCTLASGTATAAASELQIPASSGLGLGTTGYDHYACIDQTGSTSNVVVASGGTGLATGWGGGGSSGGGGGGAITAASGAYASGSIASGAMVDLGSQADTACATDNGSCSLVALTKRTNQNVTTLNTTAGSAIPAGTNLIGQVSLNIAAAANSATNGIYTNMLQGNAVLSATNGIFANLMVGNAAVATGTGSQGATVPRVTVATDQATNAGAALVKGGVGVVSGGSFYQAVAASQTATVLQSSTGATGDYLSHCVIYPASTTPGVVTVFDNTNTAANSAILFPGGASSVSNLVPFAIPVGAVSKNGAWEVTTGANVSVVCYGKFS